jgi:hypothetical protein
VNWGDVGRRLQELTAWGSGPVLSTRASFAVVTNPVVAP